MAKQARYLIADGVIGEVKVVVAEYPQEWLIEMAETESKQAGWRTDPARSGISNCVGDIGSHIENLVAYMTGLKIAKLCANLDIVGEGRTLDTNAEIMLKYDNGASGCYWCSQIAVGYDNALKVRIFGTKGAIEFEQEKSNYLTLTLKGEPPRTLSRGNGYIDPRVKEYNRLPSGHPEGYHEALANIYDQFMLAIAARRAGETVDESEYDYPDIDTGIDGVKFIEACVESSKNDSCWITVNE
jgi:predicted dehydrogenase